MRKISKTLARFFDLYLPDALSFCLILSGIVFAAALSMTSFGFFALLNFWGDSIWNLHSFAMQMVLILLFGHLLAQSPIVKRALIKLSAIPKSETSAIVFLVLLSSLACWLNWGFGLITAATLAISLKQKFPKLHFGFLVATGYAGFLVWHGGLSGSIPLSIAGEDKILLNLGLKPLALSETIFSSWNLLLVLALVISLIVSALLMKTRGEAQNLSLDSSIKENTIPQKPTERWLHSPWVLRVAAIFGFVYFLNAQGPFQINSVNLLLFMLVFLSYGSIYLFTHELDRSIRVVAPIVIQYPLYAGLMGLIQSSGLASMTSEFFVSLSTPQTFPLFSFLSAGLVNFFVPSGGGQWVIQGPIMLKAAMELNVPIQKVVMAIAWGDAWTNMIQPFWALPLLSMARMELKDIMSFCLIYLLVSGLVMSVFMIF